MPLADILEGAQTLPDGIFWGARLRDRMAPSAKRSLLSDTHLQKHNAQSHTHTYTVPLSPHLFFFSSTKYLHNEMHCCVIRLR